MAYYDFPHTRNYDSDLGFLIKRYKELIEEYKSVNDKYDTLIKIYEMVQKDIKEITIEQLQKWLDDGTLTNLIFSQFIIMSSFEGKNDNEIVQNCLDYALTLEHKVTILVDRVFNISETIMLKNLSTDYRYIRLVGICKQNGFKLTTNTTMFSSEDSFALGGYEFENISFYSENEITILFNLNRLIRMTFSYCYFTKFTYVFYCPDKYVQSLHVNNSLFTYNTNILYVPSNLSFDIVFDKNGFEEQNTNGIYLSGCNNFVFTKNTMEGLKGYSIKINGGGIIEINNNYFELNQSYLDMSLFQGIGDISHNFVYDSDTTKYFIKLATAYALPMTITNNHVENIYIGYWEKKPDYVLGYAPSYNRVVSHEKTNYNEKWLDNILNFATPYTLTLDCIFDSSVGVYSSTMPLYYNSTTNNITLDNLNVTDVGDVDLSSFTLVKELTGCSIRVANDMWETVKGKHATATITVS